MHWILTHEQTATYVARGFVHPKQDPIDWSMVFRRAGGGSVHVAPYHEGGLLVTATGTRRAIAYVEDTIRSLGVTR